MKNIRKFMALICALSLVTITAGCGNKEESAENGSSAETVTAEVTTVAPEEETEQESEEISASETEESVEETTEESEESESSNDDETEIDGSVTGINLDKDGTLGSMNYKYCSEWIEQAAGDQITYTLNDLSGVIVVQKHAADSFGSLSEETTIQVLAEQSETAWQSLDDMELIGGEWEENVIDGKKCYSVKYTYKMNTIETTNTTFFFANFTDDSKELFAVTASSFNEATDVAGVVKEILSDISFN